MEILLFVVPVLVVVVAIILFKFIGGFFKFALIGSAVVLVIISVIGLVGVKSAFNFKDDLQSGNGLVLVTGNTSGLVSGFSISKSSGSSVAILLSDAELEVLKSSFNSRDYSRLLGNHSWLAAVNESAIELNSDSDMLDRGALLASSLSKTMSEQPTFLLSMYKKGRAVFFPDRLALKIVKILPESVLGSNK
jgi:hypothetical protein